MINSLKGKKLLVLGATSGETTLVKRAQELGVYVIATDYHTDYTFSPAKNIADEAWDISWSDIDTLEVKCREENVGGVIAGYSEFRVESLIKLCSRLNLPCYVTEGQLEITRDKKKFKDVCRNNGVPVVKEYASVDEIDEYPVIVKPVDRAGSIGISVATNRDELVKAIDYALDSSASKQIIIEKYIEHGTKIDFYYTIEDGRITLISTCDTVNAKENGYERVVQSAWLYPSRNTDVVKTSDPVLRRMIQSMGIKYGCIFFSGFVCKSGEVVFFECGFRLEGGHQYNYVSKKGPYNYLDLFILHALTGSTENLSHSYKVNEKLKAATINIYAKDGIIDQIKGFEKVNKLPDCCLAIMSGRIGEQCDMNHAILSKIAMFQFTNQSSKQLQKDVEEAYELFKIYDKNGADMIYDRVESHVVADWWNLQDDVDVIVKNGGVTYEQIQQLLNMAHKENESCGLIYATANQTVEKLISKIGDGICFVALKQDGLGNKKLVGTCTLEERLLRYWYIGDDIDPVLLLKLVGVHPNFKGMGIGGKLMECCIRYAKNHGYKMIVTDSAEENLSFRKLVERFGFLEVDCVKYAANSFISTVYAKWVNDKCPWSDEIRAKNYALRRKMIVETHENRT